MLFFGLFSPSTAFAGVQALSIYADTETYPPFKGYAQSNRYAELKTAQREVPEYRNRVPRGESLTLG